MEISIKGMHQMNDESIKDAYVYFYITIEQNEHFGEKNIIVKCYNAMMIEFLKGELVIRDIQISELINRAIRIINTNNLLK